MKWSIISGGAWLMVGLFYVSLFAVLPRFNQPPPGFDFIVEMVLMPFWMACVGFAPLGLAYGSFLTIRSSRQRDNPWQKGDARDALWVNLVAWIFGGLPALLVLFIFAVPNS